MSDEDVEPTLGERMHAIRREQYARAREAGKIASYPATNSDSIQPRSSSNSAKISGKGASKSGPREMSFRRPVPQGRYRCLGLDDDTVRAGRGIRKNFDPRFEEHCGDLLEEHVERNFAFVEGMREKERNEMENQLKKRPDDERLRAQLRKTNAYIARRNAEKRRREIIADAKKKEKEAVKEGKKPYFLKESDIRELELKEKFKELKQKGGLKKYIEKRRKRMTSKDRKRLPQRRGPGMQGG